MAEYAPTELKSKSSVDVVIRSAVKRDAAAILELSKDVIGEEIYQLTSGAEFKMTIDAEEKWIESHLANPNHIILVAEMNSKIVGLLDLSNGHRQRIVHTGEFGMSVEKSVRDQGIGSLLLQVLIDWAAQNKTIEKIGLNVHSNNERAIGLYKKMGFEIEGIRKRDLKYGDGQYVDTTVMGRFV
jgi:RimJ/RimL family protein N-acetyltransferase